MGRQGFTLIEIVIVVAVIAVMAMIAIPNLLRSRSQTNEAAAIENIRTICSAEVMCHTAKKTYGSFAVLTDSSNGPPFLNEVWRDGDVRQGYRFTLTDITSETFTCQAEPDFPGSTGARFFLSNASGLIHWNAETRATTADPTLGSR